MTDSQTGIQNAAQAGAASPQDAGDAPLLELERIVVHYPVDRGWFGNRNVVHAVDGVSLAIGHGEAVGIVGESGSGKSTLGRIALDLERPTSGIVRHRGRELGEMSRDERRRFMRETQAVFQDPGAALNPRMRVRDLVAEPLDIHNLTTSKQQRRDRVAELLRVVGLSPAAADRYPHEFSGGQRQRITIARALSTEPSLIMLDEPVSALDVSIRAQVLNLLRDLQQRFAISYIFIAHDLAVVEFISDRVGVMYLGELVEIAETSELFTNPRHPYTIALLAAVPSADRDRERFVLSGEIPSPIDPPSGCRFRTRCPIAIDQCLEEPPLIEIAPSHRVACWRAGEIESPAFVTHAARESSSTAKAESS